MDENHDNQPFDYSFVPTTARVATYDDMRSAPRITEVQPAQTNEFIEKLTTTVYDQARQMGGKIPYTLIREVSENFIHAQFREIVVSILDDGNTVRFADQGPGIREKQKAQEPGFTSAIEPMKKYIRGVGSGFPLVKDYLDHSDGSIQIEDNLVSGAVVTISLEQPSPPREERHPSRQPSFPSQSQTAVQDKLRENKSFVSTTQTVMPLPAIPLSEREKSFLNLLLREGELGITDVSTLTDTPVSTTYNTLGKLEEAGLVEKLPGKKRALTELGYQFMTQ